MRETWRVHKQTHARTTCPGQAAAGRPPRKQVVTAAGAGIEGKRSKAAKGRYMEVWGTLGDG